MGVQGMGGMPQGGTPPSFGGGGSMMRPNAGPLPSVSPQDVGGQTQNIMQALGPMMSGGGMGQPSGQSMQQPFGMGSQGFRSPQALPPQAMQQRGAPMGGAITPQMLRAMGLG